MMLSSCTETKIDVLVVNSTFDCCICYEKQPLQIQLHPSSSHYTCSDCFAKLMKHDRRCPMCRLHINISEGPSQYRFMNQLETLLLYWNKSSQWLETLQHVVRTTLMNIHRRYQYPRDTLPYFSGDGMVVNPLTSIITASDGKRYSLLEYHMAQYPIDSMLDISPHLTWGEYEMILKTWHKVHARDVASWQSSFRFIFHDVPYAFDLHRYSRLSPPDDDKKSLTWGQNQSREFKNEVEIWKHQFYMQKRISWAEHQVRDHWNPFSVYVMSWMLRHPATFALHLQRDSIVFSPKPVFIWPTVNEPSHSSSIHTNSNHTNNDYDSDGGDVQELSGDDFARCT